MSNEIWKVRLFQRLTEAPPALAPEAPAGYLGRALALCNDEQKGPGKNHYHRARALDLSAPRALSDFAL